MFSMIFWAADWQRTVGHDDSVNWSIIFNKVSDNNETCGQRESLKSPKSFKESLDFLFCSRNCTKHRDSVYWDIKTQNLTHWKVIGSFLLIIDLNDQQLIDLYCTTSPAEQWAAADTQSKTDVRLKPMRLLFIITHVWQSCFLNLKCVHLQ